MCRQAAWVYGKIISIVSRNLVLLVTTECDCAEDVVSSGHISSGRMSAALLLPCHLELATTLREGWTSRRFYPALAICHHLLHQCPQAGQAQLHQELTIRVGKSGPVAADKENILT